MKFIFRKVQLEVNDLQVLVVRKNIKHMNLYLSPPHGDVRVSVPWYVSNKQVRQFVLSKLIWIQHKQAIFAKQVIMPTLNMISGEILDVFGMPYQLEVLEGYAAHRIELKPHQVLNLYVRTKTTMQNRECVLQEWYRMELKQRIPLLIAKWEPVIGKKVHDWGVKKMKTRWGSCNIAKKRIWLNLSLATKPEICLEYVVVHEMVHLLERYHNRQFRAYMDRYLPQWRDCKKELSA